VARRRRLKYICSGVISAWHQWRLLAKIIISWRGVGIGENNGSAARRRKRRRRNIVSAWRGGGISMQHRKASGISGGRNGMKIASQR